MSSKTKKKLEKWLWIVVDGSVENDAIIKVIRENDDDLIVLDHSLSITQMKEVVEQKIKELGIELIKGKLSSSDELEPSEKLIFGIDVPFKLEHKFFFQIIDDRDLHKDALPEKWKTKLEKVLDTFDGYEKYKPYYLQLKIAYSRGGYYEMIKVEPPKQYPKEMVLLLFSSILDNDRKYRGITVEEEKQAIEAIKKFGGFDIEKEFAYCELPHLKVRTVIDRWQHNVHNILILCSEEVLYFFGDEETVELLYKKFNGEKELSPIYGKMCWTIKCGKEEQEKIKSFVSELYSE